MVSDIFVFSDCIFIEHAHAWFLHISAFRSSIVREPVECFGALVSMCEKKTRKRHWNLLSKSVTTILILADIVHYHLHITLRFAGYIGNDCVDSNYIITLYNYFKYKRRLFNLLTFVCPQYTDFVSFPDNLRFIHAAKHCILNTIQNTWRRQYSICFHGSAEGDNSNTTVANFHVNTRFH